MHAERIPRVTPAFVLFLALMGLCSLLTGCGDQDAPTAPGDQKAQSAGVRTLTLGAYTTPREVYGQGIIPAFQRHWKAKTGEDVRFEASYLGSGAQARAIVGGFEADVAALSLEPGHRDPGPGRAHHPRLARRGQPGDGHPLPGGAGGAPGQSAGDTGLGRPAPPGLAVLTPNVRTSGGAMWNICALYGAALRGATKAPGAMRPPPRPCWRTCWATSRSWTRGRGSPSSTSRRGLGDVAITYENEVLVGRKAGRTYDYVVPGATILIENPVAVVDQYADRHGNRDLAEGFVAFLATPEAQNAFVEFGLRPVDPGSPRRPPPASRRCRTSSPSATSAAGRGRQDPVRPRRGL